MKVPHASGLVCALLLGLAAPATAQQCPFCMRAQMSMQMQMQRQQMVQQMQMQRQQMQMQQMMARQQAHAMSARPPLQAGRYIPPRTTTMLHRSTSIRSVTGLHLSVQRSTQMHRASIARLGPGPGRCVPVRSATLSHTTRITVHRTTHLQHLTREARTTVRRPAVTQRPRVGLTRSNTLQRRPDIVASRQHQGEQMRGRALRQQHRPTVQVRVRLTATCGNCHTCPHQPGIVRQQTPSQPGLVQMPPPRQPFMVVNRGPGPLRLIPGPGPRPVVLNPAPLPGFPVLAPRDGLVPVVRLPDVRPLAPIPVLRPPDLPELKRGPVAPPAPLAPLPGLLVARPPAAPRPADLAPPSSSLDRAVTTASPPDLPPLQVKGPEILPQLQPSAQPENQQPLPSLRQRPAEPRVQAVADALQKAPAHPPLPARPPYELALLPGVARVRDEVAQQAEPPQRPVSLDLVALPPPLPPLPESLQP